MRLHYKRAVVTFVLAYVAITIVAVTFSIAISVYGHFPPMSGPTFPPPSYLFAERFLPFLNLAVWMLFGWVYFRRRMGIEDRLALQRESLALGAFWLALAVVVDYVCFVRIKNPISLNPHDFYIGQFPWIYLIYATLLFAPLCSVMLTRGPSKDRTG
jgi:hypothetical protein